MPNTIVTSYNRNFPRRNDGQPTTMKLHRQPRDRHGHGAGRQSSRSIR